MVESFMDEIAHAAGTDPFELRRRMLRDAPKRRAALDLAAEKAGWNTPASGDIHRGIAVHDFHGTAAALVAEVSTNKRGAIRVHRIVCAVHCGTVINPRILESQIAGGIVFGLTAALKSSITFRNGRVQETNFDTFPLLRFDEMPLVEVHTVPSTDPPNGIGEVSVPPVAPAVANAIFAATGKRVRRLPIRPRDLVS